MSTGIQAVIATGADRPRESWDDPLRGSVSWFTLFSSDITPTDSMTLGVAEILPGGGSLMQHRHAQPELYYVLEGSGVLMLDGRETAVGPGSAVFIPGEMDHGLRNDTQAKLKILYVFPTGAFSDVVYRFPDSPT